MERTVASKRRNGTSGTWVAFLLSTGELETDWWCCCVWIDVQINASEHEKGGGEGTLVLHTALCAFTVTDVRTNYS